MQTLVHKWPTAVQLIVIVLLSAITVGFFSQYERYKFTGEDLLDNGDFQQQFKGWEKKNSRGSIVVDNQGVLGLNSRDGKEIMYVRQYVRNIHRYQFFKFMGKIRTEGVVPGKKPWQAAHLLVIGVGARGQKLWHGSFLLAKRHGTNDWQYHEQVFRIDSDAKEFLVKIQLSMVKGAIWAKEMRLRPVKEKSAYKIYRSVAIILWGIVIFWVLFDYLRNCSFNLKQVPVAVLVAGVSAGILMPYHIVAWLNEVLFSLFPWEMNAESLLAGTEFANIFSIWHFMAFALLASVVCWRMKPSRHLARNLGLLVLFAAVTEVLQLLVDSRKSESMDFIADIAGIAAALISLSVWGAFRWMPDRKIVKSS